MSELQAGLCITLLVTFQVKHFLADFPLQNKYMLGKFKGGTEWILPLASHAGVHSLFTLIISAVALKYASMDSFSSGNKNSAILSIALLLSLFDFIIHFVVDRLKASPKLGGRWKPDSPYFWWALGADQLAHHLTHYVIITYIVSRC